MGFVNWLRNAFAVPRAEDFVPTDEQRQLVEQVCRAVHRWGLAMPLQVLLESVRPLHSLSGPTAQFLAPTLGVAVNEQLLAQLTAFLQHPGSVSYFCERLQQCDPTAPAPPAPPAPMAPTAPPQPMAPMTPATPPAPREDVSPPDERRA